MENNTTVPTNLNEKIVSIIDNNKYCEHINDFFLQQAANEIEKLIIQEKIDLLKSLVDFPYVLNQNDLYEKITELTNQLNNIK